MSLYTKRLRVLKMYKTIMIKLYDFIKRIIDQLIKKISGCLEMKILISCDLLHLHNGKRTQYHP